VFIDLVKTVAVSSDNARIAQNGEVFETFCYPVSRGFCEGAAAVSANFRFRISIKLRMYIIELGR
jgi:hypothetical protein